MYGPNGEFWMNEWNNEYAFSVANKKKKNWDFYCSLIGVIYDHSNERIRKISSSSFGDMKETKLSCRFEKSTCLDLNIFGKTKVEKIKEKLP